jgi:hypothetical protein
MVRGFGHPNKQDDCACNLDTRQGHRRTKVGVASLAMTAAMDSQEFAAPRLTAPTSLGILFLVRSREGAI